MTDKQGNTKKKKSAHETKTATNAINSGANDENVNIGSPKDSLSSGLQKLSTIIGTPEAGERFLILTDASKVLGRQTGNVSRSKLVKKEHLQVYVQKEGIFYPVKGKTILVVDMSQFDGE